MNLSEWMRQWGQEGDDEQVIRGTLGRLLFGSNDVVKKVQVLSGGEKGRRKNSPPIMGQENNPPMGREIGRASCRERV